ncbi:MAG: magnesium protoporphyrin IX methyltransferase [Myxococcaceae bacterium]|nr:magnesium protoporphyrin IX methyltransferase [Myxococcaceae bacterium]
MDTAVYALKRDQLEQYFDRTAAKAWANLTSTGPVGYIRSTVRAGRDRMRGLLGGWLPEDLSGLRVLDAGCGTGALAIDLARRGAQVVAIDLSPTLVALARERAPRELAIDFRVSDMLDPKLGDFDHVVAMDSLIHYPEPEMAGLVGHLAKRARRSVLVTFAPRTFLLSLMHAAGRLFPRGNRSPDLTPIAEKQLVSRLRAAGLVTGRTERVKSGFYTSQALELRA